MKRSKSDAVLTGLAVALLVLAGAFLLNLWGNPPAPQVIELVDTNFLSTATARVPAEFLFRTGADLSDFDCYACHDKNKPPPIRYDKEGKIIVPVEHKDIVMEHGSHDRNNLCFNCHNETKLDTLQTRDRREIAITNSPALCGSCHGPTYRDWERGIHGRTSGYWNTQLGPMNREVCTACHDPHHPKFPGRKPAPGPHLLHPVKEEKHQTPNAKETSNSKSQNSNQPVTVTWSLKFGLFI
ncbi:MAG: hypothetical protein ACXWC8_02975 [Limisphaerales bacterium]